MNLELFKAGLARLCTRLFHSREFWGSKSGLGIILGVGLCLGVTAGAFICYYVTFSALIRDRSIWE